MKKKYSILIVDDAFFIRNLIKRAIGNKPSDDYPYEFEIIGEALNGEEGLMLYKAFKPDIITVDVNMGSLGGVSLIKKLQEFDKDAKIIVISSGLDTKLKNDISNLGCFYIQKPFQEAYLWSKLDAISQSLLNKPQKPIEVKREKNNKKNNTHETVFSENNKQKSNKSLEQKDIKILDEAPKSLLENAKINKKSKNTIESFDDFLVEDGLSINDIKQKMKNDTKKENPIEQRIEKVSRNTVTKNIETNSLSSDTSVTNQIETSSISDNLVIDDDELIIEEPSLNDNLVIDDDDELTIEEPSLNDNSVIEDDELTIEEPSLNNNSVIEDDELTIEEPSLNNNSVIDDDELVIEEPSLNNNSVIDDDELVIEETSLNDNSVIEEKEVLTIEEQLLSDSFYSLDLLLDNQNETLDSKEESVSLKETENDALTIEDDVEVENEYETSEIKTNNLDFEDFEDFEGIEFNIENTDEYFDSDINIKKSSNNVDSASKMELNPDIDNYNKTNDDITPSKSKIRIAPPKDERLKEIYSNRLEQDYNVVFTNLKDIDVKVEKKEGFISRLLKKIKKKKR